MSGKRESPVVNIGYDPGFGNNKMAAVFASSGEGPEQELTLTMRTAVVPSVVGVGDTETGLLGRVGIRGRRLIKPLEVVFRGLSYVVGPNVQAFTQQPAQRLDFNRLADGPELRALFYATAHELLKGGQHTANVMIGLPVEIMKDRAVALATLRTLRRWMVSTHEFSVNDDEVALTIEKVSAAEQPAGAWYAWGVDNAGKWAKRAADPMTKVGVCDPGFNTLDLWVIENGAVFPSATRGDTVGMRRAAEILSQSVHQLYNVKLSLPQADELVTARRPILSIADGDVPVGDLVEQALAATAANIVTFIESTWGNARQWRYMLCVGGGVEIPRIRKAIEDHAPHAVILPNPITANAVGLARLAQRQFRANK